MNINTARLLVLVVQSLLIGVLLTKAIDVGPTPITAIGLVVGTANMVYWFCVIWLNQQVAE